MIPLRGLLAMLLVVQPRMLVASLAVGTHAAGSWPACCPHQDPMSSPAQLPPSPPVPSLRCCRALFVPRCSAVLNFLAFVLAGVHRLPVRPFLPPAQIPSQGSSVLQRLHRPALPSPANPARPRPASPSAPAGKAAAQSRPRGAPPAAGPP